MTNFFLKIFDYLHQHKRMTMGAMFALIAILLGMMSTLQYNENIYDFLPISGNEQKALTLYQDISGGQKLFVLFKMKDGDTTQTARLAEAVDTFQAQALAHDGHRHITDLMTQVDFDKVLGITDFMYHNMAVMLTDSDYVRMERQLSNPAYISEQLSRDVESIMMPAVGFFSSSIANDPLQLFSPVIDRLKRQQSRVPFLIDDGYIYTNGGKYAVAMITSPYGAMESANNALLVDYVDSVARHTMQALPDVEVAATGSPVIAVGNASQIRADSQWAISIAVTLILLLLMYAFRRFKHLLLIGLSIVFGWLFAMGFIAVLRSDVSLIVIGIGSVIIGIAVNYPLHFIAHTSHAATVREALKEMVPPLLIGNITTVGAFASLLPLSAPALHDLGLFAAFMLIGTILFVLVFLPHLVNTQQHATDVEEQAKPSTLFHGTSSRWSRWGMIAFAVLTLVLGYFSLFTSFDTNMQHINFMSETQKALLSDLHASAGINDTVNVYVVCEGQTYEDALVQRTQISTLLDSLRHADAINAYTDATSLIAPPQEQERRIGLWNDFWNRHREEVIATLRQEAPAYGFNDDAFSQFEEAITVSYSSHPFDYFDDLRSVLLANSFSNSTGACAVVDVIDVRGKDVPRVVETLNAKLGHDCYAFDFVGMNSAVANSLSDDFNYIGFACSCIVFVFLWLSFGRLELALLSFLPMALGWIWILGMMQLLGMKFNIVNVILATFIFGQGDDYTIFITDGLINEYAYRKRLLASYKHSIVISALIMFIGMGALIVARHPALHSLAEVTIVGMTTVVLMAWLVPPKVFTWIVSTNGKPRRVPVTLEQVIRITYCAVVYLTQVAYGTICGVLANVGTWRRAQRQLWLHRIIQRSMYADITHIWGVPVHISGQKQADFSRPSIILCNHQSMLDPIYILALDPRIVIVIGRRVWRNPIVHPFFRLAGYLNVHKPFAELKNEVSAALAKGYSVCIFPEGLRTDGDRIARFHKGAFNLARELEADIQPIFLHGTAHIMTRGSAFPPRGRIDVEVGRRITADEINNYGTTERVISHTFRHIYQEHFSKMCREIETTHYFHEYIIYKYMYKGIQVERETRRLLKKYNDFSDWIDGYQPTPETGVGIVSDSDVHQTSNIVHQTSYKARISVINAGYGQFSLLFALVHPDIEVHSYTCDADMAALANACAPKPANLYIHLIPTEEAAREAAKGTKIINFSDFMQ